MYWVIFYWYCIRTKWKIVEHIRKKFTASFEESKIVYFTALIMKHMVAPAKFRSKFQAKLICCITFGSPSSACYLLNLVRSYNSFWNNYSPENKQLCSHLLDLLQFFECYHMFSTTFNWDIKKAFFDQLEHCIPLFLILEDCILFILSYLFDFQTIKQKVLFALWKFESINESKYWFCICAETFGLHLFQLIVFLNQI